MRQMHFELELVKSDNVFSDSNICPILIARRILPRGRACEGRGHFSGVTYLTKTFSSSIARVTKETDIIGDICAEQGVYAITHRRSHVHRCVFDVVRLEIVVNWTGELDPLWFEMTSLLMKYTILSFEEIVKAEGGEVPKEKYEAARLFPFVFNCDIRQPRIEIRPMAAGFPVPLLATDIDKVSDFCASLIVQVGMFGAS